MSNEYPRMIYKDGKVGDDWRIVQDADEEAAAKGYSRHDRAAKAAPAKPEPEDVGEGEQEAEAPAPAKRGRPRKGA